MQLKFKLTLLFLLSLVIFNNFPAQKSPNSNLSNEEIEKTIDANINNPTEMWKLINFYISKSKKEQNKEALFYAYRYASVNSTYPINLKYADSALIIAKNSEIKKILIDAYLHHGNVNMAEEFYEKALDDILAANKLSQEIGDEYILNKTIYYIAQNKIYLGQYEDARKELLISLKYFKDHLNNKSSLGKNYQVYYLYSLMSLIDSNIKLGNIEENKALLEEAFSYIKDNKLDQYTPYFITSEGMTAYYLKDYNSAISKFSESIRLYNDQWDHNTEVYYLGLSYWHIGKEQLAVKYLEEIDKHYEKTKKLDPQFRSAYEILIKYYNSIGDTKKQLEYINKLMFLDRSYEKNYKYLYERIVKEYDTKKLIAEKNRIESTLQNQRAIFFVLIIVLLGIFLFFGYRIYKEKQNYKKRFEAILAQQSTEDATTAPRLLNEIQIKSPQKFNYEFYNKIPGLNPIFVESILKQLENFEKEEKFLDSQVSQKSLSEDFGTNSTYFSKIINTYKGKNFTLYINDLRLDYIITHLKNDVKYINMDVKELASISGFSSTENFSDNFRRKFDLKPSVFIKMMKEKL
ncbi:helix-turn-helix domain-containing protein [Kaistella faecalis]|uniref:helix-turn-helix domain-containing protein n=1 Tax=Kaistella faecalis TaxID=2852098 RepID=UPI001C48B39C|nr:helix-turn-helix domain-containing protein [Chryseobacterium faecale]UFK97677.1 helix-turn-helix domain-containing protein [Chryseobacterium faecale]